MLWYGSPAGDPSIPRGKDSTDFGVTFYLFTRHETPRNAIERELYEWHCSVLINYAESGIHDCKGGGKPHQSQGAAETALVLPDV